MRTFVARFRRETSTVHGFILKSRSPSCAVRDAPVHTTTGRRITTCQRPGSFAAAVIERLPRVPMVDEDDIADRRAARRFLTRVRLCAAGRPCTTAGRGTRAASVRLARAGSSRRGGSGRCPTAR
jgi:hypothetical protein